MLRTVAAFAALFFVFVLVLRPLVFGAAVSPVELLATAAAVLGAGFLLRRQGARTRTLGSVLVIIGLASLAIALGLVAFVVLSCCS